MIIEINRGGSSQKQMSELPEVSIGMPVYNGESFIRIALDSLLGQTFADFELIISDNASSDKTEEICREYARRDSRIRYVRQAENQGPTANFLFVLDEAKGEYFMWAAADDVRSPDYLERNIEFLSCRSDYVASTSKTYFDNKEYNSISMGDFSIEDELAQERILRFYKGWHANSRFYGLFRISVLRSYKGKERSYFGADWAWVIHALSRGKLAQVKDGWVRLGSVGISNKTNVFHKYNNSWVRFLFPFVDLSIYSAKTIKQWGMISMIRLVPRLVWLNYRAFRLNVKWNVFGVTDRLVDPPI